MDDRTDDRRCTCPPPLTERSLRDDARLLCAVHPERERLVEEMLRGPGTGPVYPLTFTPLAAYLLNQRSRSHGAYPAQWSYEIDPFDPFWRYASSEPDSGRGWARPLEPVADEGFGVGC